MKKTKSLIEHETKTDYLNIPVGVYKKSPNGTGFIRVRSETLLNLISEDTYDDAVQTFRKSKTKKDTKGDSELKKLIPAYQPSGDYGKGVPRSMKNELATITNLVQLDFDSKDARVTDKRIDELFNKYKWIAIAQRSCGGLGFYLLVLTPSHEHYQEYFGALCDFFQNNESLIVDRAVSSINEIRFVSLSTEARVRKNAIEWTIRKKFVASTMERVLIPYDGKIIPLPDELNDPTGAHYDDIICWAGKQNSNGVPLERALESFEMDRISKHSSHYKNKPLVEYAIERVYETYAEQHGENVITSAVLRGKPVNLPEIIFSNKDKLDKQVQMVIDNVEKTFLLRTHAVKEQTYRYNGTHWEPLYNEELRDFLTDCALVSRMNQSVARLPETRNLLVEDLQDRTQHRFKIEENAFNVNNGVLIFKDGNVSLEQHSDKYSFEYKLDYDYLPEITNGAEFDKFIDRVLPDKPTQDMLFDYIGSCFIPNDKIKIEKTLILLGSGANGKSTLLTLLEALFGDAIGNFNLERLTDPQYADLELFNIENKILGVCHEARMIKESNIWKSIVSKETRFARRFYKDAYPTNNYGRLITCMNEMPRIDSVAGAMRRVLIISMHVQIPESEQDRQLNAKLTVDRSYILNKIIAGYKRVYAAREIMQSADSIETTRVTIDDNDHLLQFAIEYRFYPIPLSNDKSNKKTMIEKFNDDIKARKWNAHIELKTMSELHKLFLSFTRDVLGVDYKLPRARFKERLLAINALRLGKGDGTFYEHKFTAMPGYPSAYYVPIALFSLDDEAPPTNNKNGVLKPKKEKEKVPF